MLLCMLIISPKNYLGCKNWCTFPEGKNSISCLKPLKSISKIKIQCLNWSRYRVGFVLFACFLLWNFSNKKKKKHCGFSQRFLGELGFWQAFLPLRFCQLYTKTHWWLSLVDGNNTFQSPLLMVRSLVGYLSPQNGRGTKYNAPEATTVPDVSRSVQWMRDFG